MHKKKSPQIFTLIQEKPSDFYIDPTNPSDFTLIRKNKKAIYLFYSVIASYFTGSGYGNRTRMSCVRGMYPNH